MNYSIIRRILGVVIQFTGAFLALPAICGLFYGEKQAIVYGVLAVAYFVIGRIISSIKLSSHAYYAREGLVIVGLEVGFIYAYKAGWSVSTASLVQGCAYSQ